jgi:hypothetical protein
VKESTRPTESSGDHKNHASLSNSDAALFLSLIWAYVNCPKSPTTRNNSRERTRTGPSQIGRPATENSSSLQVTPLQTRSPRLQARHKARIIVATTSTKKIQMQALLKAFHLARERSASRAIPARKASSPGVGSSSATVFGVWRVGATFRCWFGRVGVWVLVSLVFLRARVLLGAFRWMAWSVHGGKGSERLVLPLTED